MRLAASVRQNLGLKVLSLTLALFLWSFVYGSKVIEREWNIPLRCVNLADSLMLIDEPPTHLKVRVSGPAKDLLLRLRFVRDIHARIDLSGANAPQHRISPSVNNIVTSSNTRLFFDRVLEPTIVDLRLAHRVERQVPVQVVWDGQAPGGYCLVDTILSVPRSVFCSGPDFLVESLQFIPTEPLELRKSREHYTESLKLSNQLRHLTYSPEEVEVSVPMAKLGSRSAEVTLTVIPPLGEGLNVQLDQTVARMTLSGPEQQIDALVVQELALVLDASHMIAGRYDSVQVLTQFPEWGHVIEVVPGFVGLTVFDAVASPEADSLSVEDSSAGDGAFSVDSNSEQNSL